MIAKKIRIFKSLIPFILNKGESGTSRLFIIKYIENKELFNRYRVIVSRKVEAKAVKRNKLRRRIYEALRLSSNEGQKDKNYDIILIPKKKIINAKYQDIEKDIKAITKKFS